MWRKHPELLFTDRQKGFEMLFTTREYAYPGVITVKVYFPTFSMKSLCDDTDGWTGCVLHGYGLQKRKGAMRIDRV